MLHERSNWTFNAPMPNPNLPQETIWGSRRREMRGGIVSNSMWLSIIVYFPVRDDQKPSHGQQTSAYSSKSRPPGAFPPCSFCKDIPAPSKSAFKMTTLPVRCYRGLHSGRLPRRQLCIRQRPLVACERISSAVLERGLASSLLGLG